MAASSPQFCRAVSYWLYFKALERPYDDRTVCASLGGSSCTSVSNSYDAICRGANASNCSGLGSLGSTLCVIAKGQECGTSIGLGEGLCRAGNGDNCVGSTVYEGVCRALGFSYNCNGADVGIMAKVFSSCGITY